MHFTTTFAAVALLGTASALPGKFQFEKRSVSDCDAAYNACRTKYEANMSTCASEYASCLGYNPFTAAASHTAPFPIDSTYLYGPTGSVNTMTGAVGTGPIGTGSVNPPTSSSVIVKPTSTATDGSTVTKTYTIPVEVTSTITSFVPCSTPVMSNSETTFFSTWLTVTYLTTTYQTVTTSCETIYPSSTEPTSIQASATTYPGNTVTGQASGTCPGPETVYETVVSYVTVYGGDATKSGAPATNTPIQPGSTLSWSHTGSASGMAKPTGWVKPSGYAKPSGH
ncbi:unnamed protein product [Aureobasidium mustum]|uniref:Uncharacterized protein n=1 Tax=Aureobasidium mustum TaxID=2773714 RepID=A0A9N8JIM3_9PEZI|nr:unnamed protein product [Aureobasidium mustum]